MDLSAELKETTAGLPNTCCKCGTNPGPSWYAKHNDLARSGQGYCAKCAHPKPTATKSTVTTSTSRRTRAKPKPK